MNAYVYPPRPIQPSGIASPYSVLTFNTGDLAGNSSSNNAADFGFNIGIIDYLTLEKTAGDSGSVAVNVYYGDPASSGVLWSALIGSGFSGVMIPVSNILEGIYNSVGSGYSRSPVQFKSDQLYIQIKNTDFSNNGTFIASVYAREIKLP